ncbi:MAG TPA: helix-turn-helix domain-containing protein [Bradyrhizobium sp.]|nr:helix-turn-helix domain-containing protein [Bradyrhizobium sp.]
MNKHSPTNKGRRRRSAVRSDDAQYHSAAEFARRLGVGRTTIWRLMRAGKLRYLRISATLVRIPVSEYERLGHQRRRAQLSERETTTTHHST